MTAASYPLDHGAGYAPLARDVRNLEALIQDPTALQVYVWLLASARHKPGVVTGSLGVVHLERGQALVGLRKLAAAIGRDKMAVSRALERLESMGLIARKARQEARRSARVVTVCQYGEFKQGERPARDRGADSDADSDETATRQRRDRTRELRKGKTDPKGGDAKTAKAPASPSPPVRADAAPLGGSVLGGEDHHEVAHEDQEQGAISKPKREPATTAPPEAVELARLLQSRILERDAKSKAGAAGTVDKWATPLRLLHERDGRAYSEIREVLEWSQRDPFWRGVVLSADGLRDKFDQLTAQKARGSGRDQASRTFTPKGGEVYGDGSPARKVTL